MRRTKPVFFVFVVLMILAFTFTSAGAQDLIPPEQDQVPSDMNPRDFTSQPADYVPGADGSIFVDANPIPISPVGSNVFVRKPKLWFYKDHSANYYRVELYSYNSTVTKIIEGVGTCTSLHCYLIPSNKLTMQTYFASGNYRWRVAARHGTVWATPSAWAYFTVFSAGFDDSFTTSPLGARWWKTDATEWTWNSTTTQLKTNGTMGYWTTVFAQEVFIDTDYTLRMKRKASQVYGSCAILLGQPYPLNPDKSWYQGVYFCYSNDGRWWIFVQEGGVMIKYKPGTFNNEAINENGWNELRIVNAYPYLDLWINGYYLGWFEPDFSGPAYGYIGMSMAGDSITSPLFVDWARVKKIDIYKVETHDPAMELVLEPVPDGAQPWGATGE